MTQIAEKKSVKAKVLVAVRPYVNAKVPNMGLEEYDMVIHDGTSHKEYLTCLETYGIRRHLTGLDEGAESIRNEKNPAVQRAKIKAVREKVAMLEKMLVNNDITKHIDAKDSNEFWDKVVAVKWNNYELWDKISIELDNKPLYLDPNFTDDFILISCLEAGGFSIVAKSLEDARNTGRYKFYLDRQDETAAVQTSVKKIKNKALAALDELYNKDPKKLWWIAKNIDGNSTQYKYNTPNDVVYDNMDNYINGLGIERAVAKASETFVDYFGFDTEPLRVRGIVRDALSYNYLIKKPDGNIYHNESANLVGGNQSECVEHFKNPAHAELWNTVLKQVEKHLNE